MSRTLALLLASTASFALSPAIAAAQEPLTVFLEAARDHALDAREAELATAAARSRSDEARARLLPSLVLSAGYTRNEIEVGVDIPSGAPDPVTGITPTQRALITPYDQLQASATLSVPLLDVAAWSTFFGSEVSADAAADREEAARADVEIAVVTAWHALVARRAVLASARRARETAERNLGVVEARASAGLATELDAARASADLERARQTEAVAELDVVLGERELEVLTGIAAGDAEADLDDDLHDEPALELFVGRAERMPLVRAAERDVRAAELARDAAWQALLPTVAASASERWTNAAGFGPESLWALGITASWTLDFGRPAVMGTRERELSASEVRAERARQSAETAILESWHRVRALVAGARAARAAEDASRRGAEVARARYEAGTGTQLEVSQAERDLFAAEVARIQADANLRVARIALRIRSGLGPDAEARP